ncbi:hypothetical protein TcBrA4_0020360 [Trypanosoma cruzi]|nr:hypothetical protein TcBrA4_0020360 [Trypanosoma cruzi]
MPADGRTLVALCADIRACAAAMPTAVSLVAKWAAEHSLIIDANGSGAALFCIASHGQSDDDPADHRLGGGKPRVKSHPVRLLGYAIDRHLNFVWHVTAAAGQTVPRRRQLRLGAEAGASRHTMRSLRVGCVHSALHHGGEATAPCPAPTHLHSLEVRHGDSCTASLGPRAANKDTSVHLAANPAPLRRIIGCRAPTPHERLTRLRYIDDVRGAVCLETAPSSIPGKAATSIPLPGDAVFKELRRFRGHMGISPDHIRAPHAEQRIVARDTASCSGLDVFRSRHAKAALDGVRRSVVEAACNPLGPYDAGRWTDGLLSLAVHASGSAALPLDSPDSGAPCGASPHSCWQLCMLLPSGVSCHRAWPRTIPSSPPGSSIPIAHTSPCRHRLPLGDGVTPPWLAGGARRRQRGDSYRAAFTGGLRAHSWLHVSPDTPVFHAT